MRKLISINGSGFFGSFSSAGPSCARALQILDLPSTLNALAAVTRDDDVLGEAADLLSQLTVVLRARGVSGTDVAMLFAERQTRHRK